MWAKDPDTYSGAVTNAAYVIMKRNYAPAADRLKALIAREKKMPAALQEARKNLTDPVADLHADRHRTDRRQHQLLQERRPGGIHRRDRPGAPRRVQADERRGDRGARRLQDVPARRSCCRRRPAASPTAPTPTQGARRARSGGPPARSAAADRRGRSTEERGRLPGDAEAGRPEQDGRPGDGVASTRIIRPPASSCRRPRTSSTRSASSSSIAASSRFRRPSRRR